MTHQHANYSQLRKIAKAGYNVREQNQAAIVMGIAFMLGVLIIVLKLARVL